MVRFFFAWLVFTAISGGYFYLANKGEKKEIRKIVWKVVVSAVVGLFIVAAMMFLNNLQGV